MEHRITYIADIYDIKWGPKQEPFKDSSGKVVKPRRSKTTENHRNKLFCRCGGSVEFILKDKKVPITVEQHESHIINGSRDLAYYINIAPVEEREKTGLYGYVNVPNEFEPVICPKCNIKYDNHNQLEHLSSSRTYGTNISVVRNRVFEDETKLSLCCYATRIIVNHITKKLIPVDVRSSICFNKKWKFATKTSTGKKPSKYMMSRFGLREISKSIREILMNFPKFQIDRVKSGHADCDKVEKDILVATEDYYNRLLSLLNPKDAQRMNCILNDKFNEKNGGLVRLSEEYKEDQHIALWLKYDFLVSFKIPTVMAIAMYPPMATVFFTKGLDFTLSLLNSWIVPPTAVLRKNGPTSPIKILESMVRLKALNDSKIKRREHTYQKNVANGTVNNQRYYRYDNRIPADIIPTDDRLNVIHITKKSYRDMERPESIELFMTLSIQNYLTPKESLYLIGKYGIDLCNSVFNGVDFRAFRNLNEGTSEHVYRMREVEHLFKLVHRHNIDNSGNKFGYVSRPPTSTYVDVIRMLRVMDYTSEELLETKNFNDVAQFHNKIFDRYKLVKNEIFNRKIADRMLEFQHMNCDVGSISFKVLNSASLLNNESTEMHHCVASYSQYVAEGYFVILGIQDSSDDSRATMSIRTEQTASRMFDQLKSHMNRPATNAIKKEVIAFLHKHNVAIASSAISQGGDLFIEDKNKQDIEAEKQFIQEIHRHELPF